MPKKATKKAKQPEPRKRGRPDVPAWLRRARNAGVPCAAIDEARLQALHDALSVRGIHDDASKFRHALEKLSVAEGVEEKALAIVRKRFPDFASN